MSAQPFLVPLLQLHSLLTHTNDAMYETEVSNLTFNDIQQRRKGYHAKIHLKLLIKFQSGML